jgi:hypothetical protein
MVSMPTICKSYPISVLWNAKAARLKANECFPVNAALGTCVLLCTTRKSTVTWQQHQTTILMLNIVPLKYFKI